ncbi:MAG: helix-turn-helix domain-containing protein [Pseudomonadota bacterium]
MQYVLNQKAFQYHLREKGYRNVLDFAQQVGIHRNTISQYLKGKGVFSSSFERIARTLGIDPLKLAMPVSDTTAKIQELDVIRPAIALLTKHDKKITVVLLGSRAKRKNSRFADWDIGILRVAPPISGIEFLELKSVLNDLVDDLPHNVDLINLDKAPGWFFQKMEYEPIFLDGDEHNFIYLKGLIHGTKKKDVA